MILRNTGIWCIAGIILLAFGCTDTPTVPTETAAPPGAIGLMEISLSGITAPSIMTAAARSIARGGIESEANVMAGPPLGEGTGTGIQLEPIGTSSFTYGERGAGGQRYLSATFRVRNASSDGIAYTAYNNNVTLMAVSADGTIDDTPVTRLLRFDGAAAERAFAEQLRPTGAVTRGGSGDITSSHADVFQAFTEAEAADIAVQAGLDNVFPYGFVVRNPNSWSHRRLRPDPAADQFDGVLTVAFRVPLANDPMDDPYEISVLMLAVTDTVTRITQSLEEHMVCQTDVANRAASLNVSAVNVLDGGTYVGARPVRDIAVVRTAGMPGAPVASIPDGTTAAYPLPARVLDFTDSVGVHPFIHTIEVDTADPRVWNAHMGYFSSESVPLPVGIDNFFVPGAADIGQPLWYDRGVHMPPEFNFRVSLRLDSSPVRNWSLDGNLVSVTGVHLEAPTCVYY